MAEQWNGAVYAFVKEGKRKERRDRAAKDIHGERHVKDFSGVCVGTGADTNSGILLSSRLRATARELRGQMERENEPSP